MKISMKRAISVVVAIIFMSMCCSIKSYAVSMNLDLSGDNITYSNENHMYEITATYKERSATVSLAVGKDRVITTGDNISIVQKDKIKTVEKGKNLQLDIEGVESLTNVKNEDVTWSSSDEKIATVDKSGLVTAIANGNVTIKAEYMSYSSTYDITVTDYEEDGYYNITLNKDKIQLGVGNTDVIEITAKSKDGVVRNCRS